MTLRLPALPLSCRLRRVAAALACAVSAHALAGTDLPDLGDSSARALSEQQERQLGSQAMRELRGSGEVLDDPEVNAYLQQLGHRLVSSDPNIASQPFEFFAVNSSQINAFAMPGGYVGVNTGLILLTENESELASVMAHEISHVSQHHIARQIEAQSGASLATMAALLGAIIAGASGNGQVAEAAVTGAMAGAVQQRINFTRGEEAEADRIGFGLLDRAGFDDRAMAAFFLRLQQATRIYDNATPGFLRDHPLTHERIAEAQDRAFSRPYRQVPDSMDFRFVRALLRSYDRSPEDAVASLAADADKASGADRDALRYGLAAAYLRAGRFAPAMAEVDRLDKAGVHHPMVEALAGQILQQSGQLKAALTRYQAALARYPGHLQLVYDYPRALILDHRDAEAARFAEGQLANRMNDATLHEIAAQAQAHLGHDLESHRHQGEAYAARGDLRGAIEQFQIALRSKGGDERVREIAEVRLRELRDQDRAARKDGGGSRRSSLEERTVDRRAADPANIGSSVDRLFPQPTPTRPAIGDPFRDPRWP